METIRVYTLSSRFNKPNTIALSLTLKIEGYHVIAFHDGESGLSEAIIDTYQLIILDIMLPKQSGFDVLTSIRKSSHVPILMLTAKDREVDKVSGLRMGAYDYITKPFSNNEFLACVTSFLRRYSFLYFTLAGTSQDCFGIQPNSSRTFLRKGFISQRMPHV